MNNKLLKNLIICSLITSCVPKEEAAKKIKTLDSTVGETASSDSTVTGKAATIVPATPVVPTTPTSPVPTAPTPIIGVEYSTYKNLFNENSPWNLRPVNPVLSAAGIVPKDSYYPSIAEGAYSTGIFLAKESDPAVTIKGRAGSKGINDSLAERYVASVVIPHFPANTIPATGGDGHADILDPTTNLIHSFWQLKMENGEWVAAQWSTIRADGSGWGTPANYQAGARATGVPAAAGIIRKHEYNDGKPMYEHALAMSMTYSGLSKDPGYVYPATTADWDYMANYGKVPEGALVMLGPDFDETKIGRPELRKIARTLKTYGARVVDRNSGTPYAIYVENGTGYEKQYPAGWDNNYANDLDKIRAGLRLMTSEDHYISKSNNIVKLDEQGKGLNHVSLRGQWALQSPVAAGPLGVFNSATGEMVFGPTGASAIYQTQTNGTGYNRVTWAKLKVGSKYKITVKAKNGASVRLEQHNGSNYALVGSTGTLKDGDVKEFVCNNTYWVLAAYSGVNVSSSSVYIDVVEL